MTTDNTDIFDRYFENALNEEERQNFDAKLADDAEFSQAFAEYTAVVKAVKLAGEESIRKSLDEITTAQGQPGGKIIQFRAARMLYAAAVVVVLIGTGVWAFLSHSSTPQSLYADHFEVYPGLSNTRGDSDLTALWSNFSDSYAAQEYEACMIILGEVEFSEVGPDYLIHFYGGVCLMSIDQPEPKRALKEFEEVLISDNDFHAQALWYQGLAYLSLNNPERARDKFILLQDSSKYKSQEVQEILDDL